MMPTKIRNLVEMSKQLEEESLLCEVEEVCCLHDNASIGRTVEVVFLGTGEDICQAEIVASFNQEVAQFSMEFHAQSAGDAIVESIVYGHIVLFCFDVKILVQHSFHIAGSLARITQQEGYLWAQIEVNLKAFFFAESQVGQEGDLDIIHCAGIVDVGVILIIFIPTALREVQFHLCPTYHAEIFLGNVTGGQSGIDAHQVFLVNPRYETDLIHIDAPIDSQSEIIALLTHLSTKSRAQGEET